MAQKKKRTPTEGLQQSLDIVIVVICQQMAGATATRRAFDVIVLISLEMSLDFFFSLLLSLASRVFSLRRLRYRYSVWYGTYHTILRTYPFYPDPDR